MIFAYMGDVLVKERSISGCKNVLRKHRHAHIKNVQFTKCVKQMCTLHRLIKFPFW